MCSITFVQNVHRWLTHMPVVACEKSLTALPMAFTSKADQVKWSAF